MLIMMVMMVKMILMLMMIRMVDEHYMYYQSGDIDENNRGKKFWLSKWWSKVHASN